MPSSSGVLLSIFVSGVAGWLADLVVPGVKVGTRGAIIAGVLGGFLGGWLFVLLGLATTGNFSSLIGSVIGAIILPLVYRAIAKK